ncbi:ABC transporter, periplasmic solute-binding protein [Vibrio nigripulchritudo SOn1]|uniref:ABC transporter, periplasmic solute-binding protein n=1 Tax=Vibrio nigripulchritudo SOn1 TaxID=1238450 RepID=A0AAV2W1E4_9VIBR|nr:ABC transporter substrate-binding protein [Vibrio nigripulchritudo]CCO50302.1 ABC transporter, periplasmic solute-binding protein [Vibrio nigripulchritudo SOn1]
MSNTTVSLLSAGVLACLAAGSTYANADNRDVIIVLNEELETLEPCMASQSNIGRVILQNISETLATVDPKTSELEPRLSTSWENLGNGKWRFHLRKGVTFSDGSLFTAEDVMHSLKRTLSDKVACELKARYFGNMSLKPEVVDEYTIDVSADPAQPILPLLLSALTIVPAETPIKFTRQPVGTGPYTLSEWNVGENIILKRRNDYWGETPQVEAAKYVFRSDSAVRAAMVAAGEADIVPQIAEEDANNNKTDFSYPNSETTYLRLDHSVEPLNDIRIRKALNLAIDRDAFLGTLVPEGAIVATHMVPTSTLGWNAELKPWPYDPKQAKKLIAEAKADGVDVNKAIRLIARTGQFPHATEINEALTQMFNDVGLNVKLEMHEVAEWIKFYSKPFTADRGPRMVTAQHDNSRGDPVFSMTWKYSCDGGQSGLCDTKLDGLINQASAASGEERAQLWKPVFKRVHEDLVADVFLFHMVGFSRVADRIDYTPTISTNSELPLEQIRFK